MSTDSHRYRPNGTPTRTGELPDKDTRARLRAARTKRLNRRLKPFNDLDAEVVALIERLTPGEGEELSVSVANAITSMQKLRKELLLGKLKAEEVERAIEEQNVTEEWEEVKRALGVA